jgi:spastin
VASKGSKATEREHKREEDIAQHIILGGTPGVPWEAVQGMVEPKRTLWEAVVLPGRNPEIFSGLRAPPAGVLLYGPSGSGKTYLVKAAATAAGKGVSFMKLSASGLISKCYGEPEKSVPALFRLAKKRAPCIVFIDELHELVGARQIGKEDKDNNTRRLKNELLRQLDQLRASRRSEEMSGLVLLLAATSQPYSLDPEVLRYFPERVYCPLADQNTRFALLQKLLCNVDQSSSPAPGQQRLGEAELRTFAEKMKNVSFHDVTLVCKEAAMGPIREVEPSSISAIGPTDLRPISQADLLAAMSTVRPARSPRSMQKLEEWHLEDAGEMLMHRQTS